MKKSVNVIIIAAVAGAFVCLPAVAQVAADPSALLAPTSSSDTSGIASFFVGLAAKYPWLATVLLIIGGLRVIFKPIMALLDIYVKANCSADEYAKLQSFEAGPVYKWLSFAFDFVGSVKLPVIGIKPPGAGVGLWIGLLVAVGLCTGCMSSSRTYTIGPDGKTNVVTESRAPFYANSIVTHSSRFFGFEWKEDPKTEIPYVVLGWGSDIEQIIPTAAGTNGISAPRSMTAFRLNSSLNPFSTDIEEDNGAGDVYIGGKNDTSKAIVPAPYYPHFVGTTAPATNAVSVAGPVAVGTNAVSMALPASVSPVLQRVAGGSPAP